MPVSGFLPAIRRSLEQPLGSSGALDAAGTGSGLQLHNICLKLGGSAACRLGKGRSQSARPRAGLAPAWALQPPRGRTPSPRRAPRELLKERRRGRPRQLLWASFPCSGQEERGGSLGGALQAPFPAGEPGIHLAA